jgi:choline-glycine betaine transporter
MKRRTFSAIGGWQSLLFCAGMYVVALFFSIFICSSVFYVMNSKSKTTDTEKTVAMSAGKQVLASVGH